MFFYRVVSISTVFVNKTLLSNINLEAPMFIALSQTVITAFVCCIKKKLSEVFPKQFSFPDIDVWSKNTFYAVSTIHYFLLKVHDFIFRFFLYH